MGGGCCGVEAEGGDDGVGIARNHLELLVNLALAGQDRGHAAAVDGRLRSLEAGHGHDRDERRRSGRRSRGRAGSWCRRRRGGRGRRRARRERRRVAKGRARAHGNRRAAAGGHDAGERQGQRGRGYGTASRAAPHDGDCGRRCPGSAGVPIASRVAPFGPSRRPSFRDRPPVTAGPSSTPSPRPADNGARPPPSAGIPADSLFVEVACVDCWPASSCAACLRARGRPPARRARRPAPSRRRWHRPRRPPLRRPRRALRPPGHRRPRRRRRRPGRRKQSSCWPSRPASSDVLVHLGANFPLALTGSTSVAGAVWVQANWQTPGRTGTGWLPTDAVTETASSATASADIDTLDANLAAYLDGLGPRVGLAVLDVTRGTEYTRNSDVPYVFASGMKVPIMLALLSQLEAKNRKPDSRRSRQPHHHDRELEQRRGDAAVPGGRLAAGDQQLHEEGWDSGVGPRRAGGRLGLQHDHARGDGGSSGGPAGRCDPEPDGHRPRPAPDVTCRVRPALWGRG